MWQLPADSISYVLNHQIGIARQVSVTNSDSAILMLHESIRESISHSCYNCIVEGLVSLGAAYTDKGDYENAEIFYRKILNYSLKTTFPIVSASRALNNLGNTYMYKGNYKQAMQYYIYAAQIAEKKGRNDTLATDHLIRIYNNTGTLLLHMGQYHKALLYFDQAEQMATRLNMLTRLPSIFVNKAMVYGKTGEMEKAWSYNQQAYTLANQIQYIQTRVANQIQYTQTQFLALKGLADILLSKKKPQAAIPYLERALFIRENVNPYFTVTALQSLGSAYLSLNNYELAEYHLLAALRKAEAVKAADCIRNIHHDLVILYEHTQRISLAFKHQQLYHNLKDSILNKEKTEAVNLLEVKYRTAEKEKEITQKQLLINQQKRKIEHKNIWIAGISATTIFLTTIASLLYSRNRHKQHLQSEQIRSLQQKQEIDRLKALMEGEEKERVRIAQDLHDGIVVQFSAAKMNLRSLSYTHSDLAGSADFQQVVQQLDNATRDLRQTAHNLLPDILLEEGLAEAVYYFCKNLKLSNGLDIDFQLYGTIPRMPADFELSLYRIIQELVHNIIKHASATHALVQLTAQNSLLTIAIEDNGIGLPQITINSKKGIGLKNIKTRVATLRGQIDIHSNPGNGTIVYLEFDTDSFI